MIGSLVEVLTMVSELLCSFLNTMNLGDHFGLDPLCMSSTSFSHWSCCSLPYGNNKKYSDLEPRERMLGQLCLIQNFIYPCSHIPYL